VTEAAASNAPRIRTVLVGATGRMGAQIVRVLPQLPQLQLIGALASPGSAHLGEDVGAHAGAPACGVPISADLPALLASAQLVIDFSSAASAAATLAACMSARTALLLGTTGLSAELEPQLSAASRELPLLVAPNTSLGVTLLLELVRAAAAALPAGFDIEIIEAHHRHKRDAPSGTALALAAAAAQGRGVRLNEATLVARSGRLGKREPGQIGFAVMRGGDVVGEHAVAFLGDGESLWLRHSATDRAVFARGALLAGVWLAAQRPGRYAMKDMLVK